MDLRQCALDVLCIADPTVKAAQARKLHTQAPSLEFGMARPTTALPLPGRPSKPELVHPAKVPRRSPAKPEGLAALPHAIAHIEFNAIKTA